MLTAVLGLAGLLLIVTGLAPDLLPRAATAALTRALARCWAGQLRLWDVALRDLHPWARPEDG